MSSSLIHPTAVLDASVELGHDVEIGAYSVIGPNTRIGNGCKIDAHVVIKGYTTLGDFCKISSWAVIGGDPQHMQITSSPSWVEIGDKVVIREYVTIHRSNNPLPDIENQKTVVGNHTLIMAYSHIAHDCILGERVILANQVQLAGHVILENDAFLGGRVMVHQFVRIGEMAMIGANAIVLQDVPPFALSAHSPAEVYGINSVGLKRHGLSLSSRNTLKKAYIILLQNGLNRSQALETIQEQLPKEDPYLVQLLDFIENSKRGIRLRPSKRRIKLNEKDDSIDTSTHESPLSETF